jgi:hypothetical protein
MTTTTHPTTQSTDLAPHLAEQLTWHWDRQLRPRLEGLTDEEYRWEPVHGCWNVRPRGTSTTSVQAGTGAFTIDFEHSPPQPAPVTTIAWRIGHLVVGVLGMRNHSHFGGPALDYESFEYAGTADGALAQLDEHYDRWITAISALTAEQLWTPVGPAEGPFAALPMLDLVLHIHREVLHHGAELALLRDLYAHR